MIAPLKNYLKIQPTSPKQLASPWRQPVSPTCVNDDKEVLTPWSARFTFFPPSWIILLARGRTWFTISVERGSTPEGRLESGWRQWKLEALVVVVVVCALGCCVLWLPLLFCLLLWLVWEWAWGSSACWDNDVNLWKGENNCHCFQYLNSCTASEMSINKNHCGYLFAFYQCLSMQKLFIFIKARSLF